MFVRSDTPTAYNFSVGDEVRSGASIGTVVTLDADEVTMGIVWNDGDGGVINYPLDATYIEKRMPWE